MTPDIFDCQDFKDGRVKVTFNHFGLPFPTEHSLDIRVKYESKLDIQYFSTAIQIIVRMNPAPSILNSLPRVLTIPSRDLSVSFPDDLLDLNEFHSGSCRVAPNVLVSSYPKFGKLVSEDPDFGSMQKCSSFFEQDVSYQLLKPIEEISSSLDFKNGAVVDFVPLMVSPEGSKSAQFVTVPIQIREGKKSEEDESLKKSFNIPRVKPLFLLTNKIETDQHTPLCLTWFNFKETTSNSFSNEFFVIFFFFWGGGGGGR